MAFEQTALERMALEQTALASTARVQKASQGLPAKRSEQAAPTTASAKIRKLRQMGQGWHLHPQQIGQFPDTPLPPGEFVDDEEARRMCEGLDEPGLRLVSGLSGSSHTPWLHN